jgi:hypothetical protein
MKFLEVELPTNKKFGFFFTLVFVLAALYFYLNGFMTLVYLLVVAAVIFLFVTIVKADILLPVNKLWMKFGLLIGMIVGPIVLGIIFFGMFTPIAFLMRLGGRDELRLKFKSKPSYWILRSKPIYSESFKQQF